MEALLRALFGLLETVLVVAVALMVALVFGNVVLRYLFASGVPFAEEVSRYLFVWVTFIGALVAARERLHIAMLGLVRRLPSRLRCATAVASGLLIVGCCFVLALGSLQQTAMNWSNRAQISGLPMFLVYAVPAVFAAGMALIALGQVVRALRGIDTTNVETSSRTSDA